MEHRQAHFGDIPSLDDVRKNAIIFFFFSESLPCFTVSWLSCSFSFPFSPAKIRHAVATMPAESHRRLPVPTLDMPVTARWVAVGKDSPLAADKAGKQGRLNGKPRSDSVRSSPATPVEKPASEMYDAFNRGPLDRRRGSFDVAPSAASAAASASAAAGLNSLAAMGGALPPVCSAADAAESCRSEFQDSDERELMPTAQPNEDAIYSVEDGEWLPPASAASARFGMGAQPAGAGSPSNRGLASLSTRQAGSGRSSQPAFSSSNPYFVDAMQRMAVSNRDSRGPFNPKSGYGPGSMGDSPLRPQWPGTAAAALGNAGGIYDRRLLGGAPDYGDDDDDDVAGSGGGLG